MCYERGEGSKGQSGKESMRHGKRKGREWVTKTNDTQTPLQKQLHCKTNTNTIIKKQEEFEHISEDMN